MPTLNHLPDHSRKISPPRYQQPTLQTKTTQLVCFAVLLVLATAVTVPVTIYTKRKKRQVATCTAANEGQTCSTGFDVPGTCRRIAVSLRRRTMGCCRLSKYNAFGSKKTAAKILPPTYECDLGAA